MRGYTERIHREHMLRPPTNTQRWSSTLDARVTIVDAHPAQDNALAKIGNFSVRWLCVVYMWLGQYRRIHVPINQMVTEIRYCWSFTWIIYIAPFLYCTQCFIRTSSTLWTNFWWVSCLDCGTFERKVLAMYVLDLYRHHIGYTTSSQCQVCAVVMNSRRFIHLLKVSFSVT